jgi:hypothetical protein
MATCWRALRDHGLDQPPAEAYTTGFGPDIDPDERAEMALAQPVTGEESRQPDQPVALEGAEHAIAALDRHALAEIGHRQDRLLLEARGERLGRILQAEQPHRAILLRIVGHQRTDRGALAHQSANGLRTRIVSSRSGLVERIAPARRSALRCGGHISSPAPEGPSTGVRRGSNPTSLRTSHRRLDPRLFAGRGRIIVDRLPSSL